MSNREIIQKSIDYIEDNLKTELTAQELSKMSGFSLFYYYRLFQTAVGLPVMQYILRRKLLNAIYEISCGEKVIDVALLYGFDTHSGFYKAFVREFGYTPTQFLKSNKVKKPYRINILKEEHIMITHKKITEILKFWGLDKEPVFDIIYEATGNKNEHAFYVGNKYVIKFSANLGKVKKHIEISKALEVNGLYAATPIKTQDGRDYILDGEIYFYLTKRLEGKQLGLDDVYGDDYITKARYIGEVIGHLSLSMANIDALVSEVNIFKNVTEGAIPKVKDILNISKDFYKEYSEKFGALFESLPKQIIHRDPNPGNIIIADDKWGFIDFELSEKNIRIFDPCYAATAILSESFKENDNEKLSKWVDIYKNIIYGYDEVVKLTSEEKKAIPYVILSNQLICVAWFSKQEKYRDIYQVNKKMTEWLVNNISRLD